MKCLILFILLLIYREEEKIPIIEFGPLKCEGIVLESQDILCTTYQAVKSQTDNTPFITANGTDLRKHKNVVAISRDLLHKFPNFYERTEWLILEIDGIKKVMKVSDLKNKRIGTSIDILTSGKNYTKMGKIYYL